MRVAHSPTRLYRKHSAKLTQISYVRPILILYSVSASCIANGIMARVHPHLPIWKTYAHSKLGAAGIIISVSLPIDWSENGLSNSCITSPKPYRGRLIVSYQDKI